MNSISYAAYIGDNFSRINKEKIASIMNYFGYTASQMGSGNTIKDKIKILSDDVSDLKASNNLSTQYGTRIGAIENEIAEAVTRVSNTGVTNPKLYDAIGKIVAMLSTTDGNAS